MIHEYLNIGYIRSNCLSKVASLIDDLPITQFSVARSKQEKKKIETSYKWLSYNLRGSGDFKLNWNIWKDRVPFKTVLSELTKFKSKYRFEDFTISRIEIGIDSDVLVHKINNCLSNKNKEFIKYKKGTRFYVLFVNRPLSSDIIDGWDAKVVRDINLNAIVNLGFKRGVLDLVGIESDLKKRDAKKIEDIDFVLGEKDIIRLILSKFKTDRWFKFPEVQKHFVNGHHPYPGAIRTYERTHGHSKWAFSKDEEVVI